MAAQPLVHMAAGNQDCILIPVKRIITGYSVKLAKEPFVPIITDFAAG